MLWTYQHVVEPNEAKLHPKFINAGERSFDAIIYPHYLVMAFLNWPIGVKPANPATVMAGPTRDSIMRHYVMRNRWSEDGKTDVVVSVLGGARGQNRFGDARSPVIVWGHGKRILFNCAPATPKGGGGPADEVFWQGYADGSASLTLKNTALAVDFSKASGADAVLVMVNPLPVEKNDNGGLGEINAGDKVAVGGTTFHVLVLGGTATASADGGKLKVGGQSFSYDGKKITMEKTAPRWGE